MGKEKLEKYAVIVNFSGVILAFLGVIIGAYIVNSHQNRMYRAERSDKRIEKKEQLLEEAYRVYAKMGEIRFWQTEIQVTAKDTATAQNWIYKLDKERNPVISKQFSDLLAINKMIELYFGEQCKKLVIHTFSPNNHKNGWWNISNEQLNSITESMAEEIRKELEKRD